MKAGIIGCGNISGVYIENLRKMFDNVDVKSCSDINMAKARAVAEKYGIKAMTPRGMLKDGEISVIVNLTVPKAHAGVAMRAVQYGKHVYNEKPLALGRTEGKKLLAFARDKGVRVGCAPDTFLGAGMQTCRKLIDDGAIGKPVSATAFMTSHGPEDWHPNPDFFYKAGGGPMFDMGPYYLTALVSLLGPVRRVTGLARASFATREITSKERMGEVIQVEVPTHIAGVMDFQSGVIGTILTSFDVWSAHLPRIEIHGSEGSLSVPDPNCFGGQVQVFRHDSGEWRSVPLTHPYAGNSRGLGVSDMVQAVVKGRPHRASGEMAFHVLDLMCAFHEASAKGRHIELKSSCVRPEAMKSL